MVENPASQATPARRQHLLGQGGLISAGESWTGLSPYATKSGDWRRPEKMARRPNIETPLTDRVDHPRMLAGKLVSWNWFAQIGLPNSTPLTNKLHCKYFFQPVIRKMMQLVILKFPAMFLTKTGNQLWFRLFSFFLDYTIRSELFLICISLLILCLFQNVLYLIFSISQCK